MSDSFTLERLHVVTSIPSRVVFTTERQLDVWTSPGTSLLIARTPCGIEITTCSRSSVNEALTLVIQSVEALGQVAGAKVRHEGRYPGWRPEPDSILLKKALEAFKAQRGTDAQIKAIHAGLECGIIMEKAPGMKVISFGPALHSVHSPAEKLQISTVGPFYEFLKGLLKALV